MNVITAIHESIYIKQMISEKKKNQDDFYNKKELHLEHEEKLQTVFFQFYNDHNKRKHVSFLGTTTPVYF